MGAWTLAISRDGTLLAAGSRDGMVTIYDLPGQRQLAGFHAHQGTVWGVTFSPDSRTLATVGEDRLGRLWDVEGLKEPGS
jgi:WD40 repeat protein